MLELSRVIDPETLKRANTAIHSLFVKSRRVFAAIPFVLIGLAIFSWVVYVCSIRECIHDDSDYCSFVTRPLFESQCDCRFVDISIVDVCALADEEEVKPETKTIEFFEELHFVEHLWYNNLPCTGNAEFEICRPARCPSANFFLEVISDRFKSSLVTLGTGRLTSHLGELPDSFVNFDKLEHLHLVRLLDIEKFPLESIMTMPRLEQLWIEDNRIDHFNMTMARQIADHPSLSRIFANGNPFCSDTEQIDEINMAFNSSSDPPEFQIFTSNTTTNAKISMFCEPERECADTIRSNSCDFQLCHTAIAFFLIADQDKNGYLSHSEAMSVLGQKSDYWFNRNDDYCLTANLDRVNENTGEAEASFAHAGLIATGGLSTCGDCGEIQSYFEEIGFDAKN